MVASARGVRVPSARRRPTNTNQTPSTREAPAQKKRDQSRPSCGYRRRAGARREGKRDRTDSDGTRAPGHVTRARMGGWCGSPRPRVTNRRAGLRSRSLMAREARPPNRTDVRGSAAPASLSGAKPCLPRRVPSRASSGQFARHPPSRRRPVLPNRLSIGRPPEGSRLRGCCGHVPAARAEATPPSPSGHASLAAACCRGPVGREACRRAPGPARLAVWVAVLLRAGGPLRSRGDAVCSTGGTMDQ